MAAIVGDRKPLIWGLLALPAGVLCAAAIEFMTHIPSAGDSAAYLVGRALPASLLVWGVIYFALVRRTPGAIKALALPAILILPLLVEVPIAARATSGFKNLPGDMEAALKVAHGGPVTTVRSTGEAGVMAQIIQDIARTGAADRAALQAEIDRIGCTKMVAAGAIRRSTDFRTERAGVASCKVTVSQYRARFDQRLVEARAKIAAADMSDDLRQSALQGFDETVEVNRRNGERSFDLLTDILTEVDQTLELLASTRGSWTTRNDKVMFASQGPLDAFNAHMQKISQIRDQVRALEAAQNQAQRDRVNEVRAAAPQ